MARSTLLGTLVLFAWVVGAVAYALAPDAWRGAAAAAAVAVYFAVLYVAFRLVLRE